MAKLRMRQYARLIQKCGYDVQLKEIKLVTASAVATLDMKLDLNLVASLMGTTWESELFNGLNFHKEKIHYSCFTSGKICITGITSFKLLDTLVYPTLLEIQMS